MREHLSVRDALPDECEAFGELLVDVYSRLDGFPSPAEQPEYYRMLADAASLARRPGARVLVAVSGQRRVVGGVVFFRDLSQYGAGSAALLGSEASGIRLLAVDSREQSNGIGTRLTSTCIEIARSAGSEEVILHTTRAMVVARKLYERLGFRRAEDLDFTQGGMQVQGFRLRLTSRGTTAPGERSA